MKIALILGLGVSGQAAAEFLLARGYEVRGVDKNWNQLKDKEELKRLCKKGLLIFSESDPSALNQVTLFVPSPGIPQMHPLYQTAVHKGIAIVGEIELALREVRQPCLAITGTNGKTTVTLLVTHILNESGRRARSLGNIGEPLAPYFLHPDPEEILVIELSSYQLETLSAPVFDAAVLLNITPDHLDRYSSMLEYAKAKWRLQSCLKPGCSFYVQESVAKEYAPLCSIGPFKIFNSEPEKIAPILPLSYREGGEHDRENVMAAWALVRQMGVSEKEFTHALETFKKPAHRIEFVQEENGVFYFDDSKGTNIDATICAVKTMKGAVILIAGGVDKGASYAPWIPAFAGKVKQVVAIGQAAEKIQRELKGAFDVKIVATLDDAVQLAKQLATRGDAVLLSPGCSSFDMFRDYAHRGEEFKRSVRGEKNEA